MISPNSIFNYNAPITTLAGIGPSIAQKMQKIGVETVADLIFHLPLRYEDRTKITPIGDLKEGQNALIEGKVASIKTISGSKARLVIELNDSSGIISLVFFKPKDFQINSFRQHDQIRCFGAVKWFGKGLSMVHPEYQKVKFNKSIPVEQYLTPVYPTTHGLGQNRLRKIIYQVLDKFILTTEADGFCEDFLQNFDLMPLNDALLTVHRPNPDICQKSLSQRTHPAIKRLIIEELLAYHLSLKDVRSNFRNFHAYNLNKDSDLIKSFLQSLPFSLTDAQKKVIQEIEFDLMQPRPMLRLVQGDVGSGKTVIAAIAALIAIGAGKQVAFLAPTDILASQHLQSFAKWFEPFGISYGLLSASLSAPDKRDIVEKLKLGELDFVVGTHALFQEYIKFKNLALVIIDEQHRFGVNQRLAMMAKGLSVEDQHIPHQLTMTATPIPRTITMTRYANLDISIIDELPPGRKEIKTVAVDLNRKDTIIERLRAACKDGQQAYWVCTLIEESEDLKCQAAIDTKEQLVQALPELNIELVHSRIKADEKALIMQNFKSGEIDILVATTVIEVGVDVPNASLIIIEDAQRLGLAQLHQLRGRVGRGSQSSFCVLLYQNPLTEEAKARLDILRQTNDGFKIAQKDLMIRGPGEIMGTRQAGLMRFRVADFARDEELISKLPEYYSSFQKICPEYKSCLVNRWLRSGMTWFSFNT